MLKANNNTGKKVEKIIQSPIPEMPPRVYDIHDDDTIDRMFTETMTFGKKALERVEKIAESAQKMATRLTHKSDN